MTQPVFIAHRGYAAAWPENTLLAIDAARKAGARYIEVDIQLSADSVPVLFHDRDLQRLCQQPGAIHDYSDAELQQFAVSYPERFGNRFADNRMTRLQDYLAYLKKYPYLTAFIELKRAMLHHFGQQHVLQTLLPQFACMHEQVVFISYDFAVLEHLHRHTSFRTGLVVDNWDELAQANYQPEWIFCDHEGLPDENTIRHTAARIAVFEVGKVQQVKPLLQRGIRYMETFEIENMLTHFPPDKDHVDD